MLAWRVPEHFGIAEILQSRVRNHRIATVFGPVAAIVMAVC
jgi:hypothetical protein